MIEPIILLSLTTHWIYAPAMTVIGILFHLQRRTKGSLVLATGLFTILIAMISELTFPQTFETIEEATQVLEMAGPPLLWFIDDVLNSIGIIVTLLGFGLVVIEDKKA